MPVYSLRGSRGGRGQQYGRGGSRRGDTTETHGQDIYRQTTAASQPPPPPATGSLRDLLSSLVTAFVSWAGPSVGDFGGSPGATQGAPVPSLLDLPERPPPQGWQHNRPPGSHPYGRPPATRRDYSNHQQRTELASDRLRHQNYQGPPRSRAAHAPSYQGSTDQFSSRNPDFREIIRNTNQGARIEGALANWQTLPGSLDTAINNITDGIRPPMPDSRLKDKIERSAAVFKNSVRHAVVEHLTAKRGQVIRNLSHLDHTDMMEAKQIAKRQLLRSNGRINPQRADELISVIIGEATYPDTRAKAASESTTITTHGRPPPGTDEEGWSLAPPRRAYKPPTPPEVSRVETAPLTNRFSPLLGAGLEQMDVHEAIRVLEDPTQADVEPDAGAPLPQRSNVKKRDNSPTDMDIQSTPGKRQRIVVQAIVEEPPREFKEPLGCPTPAGRAPPASSHPGTPTPSPTSATATTTTTLNPPTPAASPANSSTQDRIHLSIFHPPNRRQWSMPEFRDEEDTVLITDSNGRMLAHVTPPTWRVACYRGGRLEDAGTLMWTSKPPPHIKTVIIVMGLNDRIVTEHPHVNTIIHLRDAIRLQSCRVIICTVPHFSTELPGQQIMCDHINGHLVDLYADTGSLAALPDGFMVQSSTSGDNSHFDLPSARTLVDHLVHFIHLNREQNPQ